jgi:hypothetical protein
LVSCGNASRGFKLRVTFYPTGRVELELDSDDFLVCNSEYFMYPDVLS